MTRLTLNLRELTILIADPSSYTSMIINSMLRGFGTKKAVEVRDADAVMQALLAQRIDVLICDTRLPPNGGLWLTRKIRRDPGNEYRTMPILIMTSDTREATVKQARDFGANMVVAKPLSPASLYDRLAWIAYSKRKFVDSENYFGPDRRFKIEGYPNGVGRRKGDKPVEVAAEMGPALAQGDIDSLFNASRTGPD